MGPAGMSLGRELRGQSSTSSSEPHRFGAAWHRLRTRSQTRVQTAPSHTAKMIGCIKPISPCLKRTSAELLPDFSCSSTPCRRPEWRGAHVEWQPHRLNALRYPMPAPLSGAHEPGVRCVRR
jgi:hypothetical protein